MQLQLGLPGLDQLYTGCRSIFSDIFEQGDVSLQMRWTAMEIQNGAPHIRTEKGLRDMIRFAESELGAMAIRGRGHQNTSLPLTDTQKKNLKSEQENKRRQQLRSRLLVLGSHRPSARLVASLMVLLAHDHRQHRRQDGCRHRPLRGPLLAEIGAKGAVPEGYLAILPILDSRCGIRTDRWFNGA